MFVQTNGEKVTMSSKDPKESMESDYDGDKDKLEGRSRRRGNRRAQ